MKSRAEVRFLAASFALLLGLVVPVSAAALTTTVDASVPAAVVASTAPTGSALFLQGAPQPLLLMAIGALVVLIPVTRRARRVGAAVTTASPVEQPSS